MIYGVENAAVRINIAPTDARVMRASGTLNVKVGNEVRQLIVKTSTVDVATQAISLRQADVVVVGGGHRPTTTEMKNARQLMLAAVTTWAQAHPGALAQAESEYWVRAAERGRQKLAVLRVRMAEIEAAIREAERMVTA